LRARRKAIEPPYGPERIARNEPPVPRKLVELEPKWFGPEGREQARRLVREEAEEWKRLGLVCTRTPDGGEICEGGGGPPPEPISPDDPRLENLPK
jgi:hypothetical protein